MSEKKRPGVMLYFDFRPSMKYLTREQKGDILDAIFDYGEDGMEPTLNDTETKIIWCFLRPAIERDAGRYEKVLSARQDAGKKRWENFSPTNSKKKKAKDDSDDSNFAEQTGANEFFAEQTGANEFFAKQTGANDFFAKQTRANENFAKQTMPTTTTPTTTTSSTTATTPTTTATSTTSTTATTATASTSTNTITRASAAAAAAATTTQKEKENAAKPPRARFAVPDEAQVISFFVESGDKADEAGKFYDYYASNGWVIGKSQMKDWQAAARNWMRRSTQYESAHKAAASGGARPTQTTESFIEQMRRVTGQIEPL
jgi:uncharacterized membrane protein